MDVRSGTSGWSYDHWAGVLYRPGLPAAKRLDRYAEVFDTVELNRQLLPVAGDHAEAVLVQLRADMARDDARLETFLGMVPGRIRVAMELRHPSWNHPAVDGILYRHRAAYSSPTVEDWTASVMPQRISCTSACTARTPTRRTRAATPPPHWADGPLRLPSGRGRTGGCWCIPTTKAEATRCVMRASCVTW